MGSTVKIRIASLCELARRINSTLSGITKQFRWLQASATKVSSLSITSVNLQPPNLYAAASRQKTLPISHDGHDQIDSLGFDRFSFLMAGKGQIHSQCAKSTCN
jgi:hypothetical protein